MKNPLYKLSVAAALVAAAVGASSCTNNFEEINTNPNTMVVGMATPYNMFEYLIYEPAQWNDHYGWYWHNELVQYTAFTGSSLRQFHIYKFSDGEFQTAWNANARFATNALHMRDMAIERNEESCEAIGLTLKVLFLANQVSLYGDIPYSEAFQLRDGGTSQPKFDTQKEVFEQMFAELEEANAIYAKNPKFTYPAIDGLYAGSMKKWQRFNNSLYLRLLCRVSGRTEMNVGEKMTEILANEDRYPIFRDNNDNATVFYTGIAPYVNYFYDANTTKNDLDNYRFTQQMRKLMVWEDLYNDPRCHWMYLMNANATYNDEGYWLGAMSGGTQEQTAIQDRGTAYLNYNLYVKNPSTPTTFMDYAEVQFILAEAAVKGLIPGGETAAKAYYQNGLAASVDRWQAIANTQLENPFTLIDVERDFFLDCDLTSWPADREAQLRRIAEQKYIALFMIGFEAFHELHRTGYPELTIGQGCIYNLDDNNQPVLPTRFAYPATTLATNYNNCMEALQRMGGNNNMRTHLWWSKAAIEQGL